MTISSWLWVRSTTHHPSIFFLLPPLIWFYLEYLDDFEHPAPASIKEKKIVCLQVCRINLSPTLLFSLFSFFHPLIILTQISAFYLGTLQGIVTQTCKGQILRRYSTQCQNSDQERWSFNSNVDTLPPPSQAIMSIQPSSQPLGEGEARNMFASSIGRCGMISPTSYCHLIYVLSLFPKLFSAPLFSR